MTDRWKNRRKMAWAALVAGLLFPLLLLWSESDQLGAVAGAFYVFVGAVVSAYFGFATYEDVSHDKLDKRVATELPKES
jgi:uncharacterized membrane protein YiaA